MENGSSQHSVTLLELLIVIGIIAILMTVGVILLGTARERSRDAQRYSDLSTIQGALERYFINNNRYPQAPAPVVLGTPGYTVLCSGTATGFADTRTACGNGTIYLDPIPVPPEPQPAQQPGYTYTSSSPNTTYTIDAALEGSLNGLQGKIQVTPSGLELKP